MRGRKPIHGRRARHKVVIEVLDAVSRTRALTEAESLHLEWAIKIEADLMNRAARLAATTPSGRDAPQMQGAGR